MAVGQSKLFMLHCCRHDCHVRFSRLWINQGLYSQRFSEFSFSLNVIEEVSESNFEEEKGTEMFILVRGWD